MTNTVNFTIKNDVAYLGLNRPDKKNALNKEMIHEIIETLCEHKANRSFKVLVIYGEGSHFCSGADLNWMKEGVNQTKSENISDAKLFNMLFETIYRFPKPTICEVKKSAFGGAVGIMASCDIVLCEPESTFGFPEVKLGIVPATIAPYILTKMGSSQTRKRMLFPEPFSANEAKDEGLVHFISEKDKIRSKTTEIACKIAKAAPEALIQTKDLIHKLEENIDEETTRLYCARLIASARISHEGQEGVTAFFEKREPVWNKNEFKSDV